MAEVFGMMDEAYFVSKNAILNWVNDLLKLNLQKIEQFGAGSVYCQILDAIYPGQVPMHKVNWKAKLEYECINNLKILQNAFQQLKIQKHIEIEKLAKAKYQDNLEFVQWMKRFYELKAKDQISLATYDPIARRGSTFPSIGLNKIQQNSNNTQKSQMIAKLRFNNKENQSPEKQQCLNSQKDALQIKMLLFELKQILSNDGLNSETKVQLIEEIVKNQDQKIILSKQNNFEKMNAYFSDMQKKAKII